VKLTRLVLRPRPTVRNIPADDRSAAVLHRSRRQDHWLYGAAVKQQLAGVGEMWLYVFSTLQQRGLPTPANYASRSFHSRACLAGKLSLEVFLLNQEHVEEYSASGTHAVVVELQLTSVGEIWLSRVLHPPAPSGRVCSPSRGREIIPRGLPARYHVEEV
jgi:hypothetical protein